MPRKLNPGSLTTGHGKAAPDENIQRPALSGSGLVGPGPNIGETDTPHTGDQAGSLALDAHVHDPKNAHPASAIEHDGHPELLISSNVEGALDELIGTVMEQPPYLGSWARYTTFSGIPDWGTLKLRDQSLENFGSPGLTTNKPAGTDASLIFPYYHTGPGAPQDTEFKGPNYNPELGTVIQHGGDPNTDYLWNFGTELVVGKPIGAGYGTAHNGAFTRDGDVGGPNLTTMRTHMILGRVPVPDPETGRPYRFPVTVSGALYPADRGVVALFHFPPARGAAGNMQAEFLGQPLVTDETDPLSAQGRVVAALLLGNGLLGDKCIKTVGECGEPHVCDGDPGGIFGVGADADGKYDPFAFPGRATGQYNLSEIYAGVDAAGAELVPPFNDLDGDGVVGAARAVNAVVPAPGQVRLGTDPDAGVTPVDNGIPVFGATSALYQVAPLAQLGSLGEPIHGDAIINDTNFFQYRLPVLSDYSASTGLKWTPAGEDPTNTKETARFFEPKAPLATQYPDGDAVGTTLRTAGFYESSFSDDYWVWQVARYRQSFLLPSLEVTGNREEVGSYWLVHFKKEADFEKFARDGIFPWDATDPYEVYGASLTDTTHIEADGNIVNEWPAATPPESPSGPAPLYGFAAESYHSLRSTIMQDPNGFALPALVNADWDWASQSGVLAGQFAFTVISGVSYFVPRITSTGADAFAITEIDINYDAGFWTSYRTDDHDLTGFSPGTAPAVLASVNPMQINNAPFAYDVHPGGTLASSLDLVAGASVGVAHIPDPFYQRKHRFELPFTFLGNNASGDYADTNGPADIDTLNYSASGGGDIQMRGDDINPAFTRDAKLRAYFRRPLAHVNESNAILPFDGVLGQGQLLDPIPGGTLLYHSTRFDSVNLDGSYGNFLVNPLGAPPNQTYAQFFLAEKDVHEKFLDESYRLKSDWSFNWLALQTNPAALGYIQGPGMNAWSFGPIEVPVRAGYTASPYDENSWLLMEDHLLDFTAGGPEEDLALQVAGLPDRNPIVEAGVEVPFPSTGILMYPQIDYSTNHYPASTGVEIDGRIQPDYTAISGDGRQYIRAFDLAFNNFSGVSATPPIDMAGQTEVTIRLDGIKLEDMLYQAPGPGGTGGAGRIALMAKVPGLTTWMDMGRVDGGGPSKQDPLLDGAGCMIADLEKTYSFTDPVTGYKGCYITIDVGPVASFFTNQAVVSSYVAGSPQGESPLLIKVLMDEDSIDYNLEKQHFGGIFGVVAPGADPRNVRGLIGIRVMHPQEELIAPDETGQVLVILP